MQPFNIAGFLLAAGFGTAIATSGYVQHEKRDMSPHSTRQWTKRSRAPSEASIPMRIALVQSNLEDLHDMLMEVSEPTSAKYGQHLTPQEIAKHFAPSLESILDVKQWLHHAGVDHSRHRVSPGKGYLKFNATIDEVEKLLQTQYHVFENTDSGEQHVACDEYSIPGHLQRQIDFVHPTVNMRPLTRSINKRILPEKYIPGALSTHLLPLSESEVQLVSKNDLGNCDNVVTIACIRALYDIPVSNSSVEGNELGIFEDGDAYYAGDLQQFFASAASRVPSDTQPKLYSIDGAKAPGSLARAGGESALDFELAIPLIYPQSTILYQVDALAAIETSNGFGDTFLDALDAYFCTYRGGDNSTIDPHYPIPGPNGYDHPEMCGTYKPTNVISISYALAEFYYARKYEDRQCQEWAKLGLAGTSVVYASGDAGVASLEGCIINEGGCEALEAFTPMFPASCPYVTAVGATQIAPGQTVNDPETAVNATYEDYWSGGGFSNYWSRLRYQAEAVQTYLDKYAPDYPEGTFNKSGRAYPDVSAVGLSIFVYVGGLAQISGGTSAAAPIFASIINLINENRLTAGKSPAGFLNPVLYANPAAFHDITTGSNPGCGTAGFPASPGWDPVTGLGTPNTTLLTDVFMSLP